MRLRNVLVSLASVAVGLSGLVVASPASAAPEDDPVIVSPSDGATLRSGSTPRLTIEFKVSGPYSLYVFCNLEGDYVYEWTSQERSRSSIEDIEIDKLVNTYDGRPITGASCEISAYGTGAATSGLSAVSTFTVVDPPLSVGTLSASPTTFYPRVKDRYRDTVKLSTTINRSASLAWKVTDADGRAVRRATTTGSYGTKSWVWDGRSGAGTLVRPAAYRVSVTVTAGGSSITRSVVVRVATAIVTRTATQRKDGWIGAESTSASCYIDTHEDWDDPNIYLDCWGGRYAKATYRFAIPSNATNVRWAARSYLSSSDRKPGTVSKTGHRPASNRFVVTAKVTGWRALTVERVAVTYDYRARI